MQLSHNDCVVGRLKDMAERPRRGETTFWHLHYPRSRKPPLVPVNVIIQKNDTNSPKRTTATNQQIVQPCKRYSWR